MITYKFMAHTSILRPQHIFLKSWPFKICIFSPNVGLDPENGQSFRNLFESVTSSCIATNIKNGSRSCGSLVDACHDYVQYGVSVEGKPRMGTYSGVLRHFLQLAHLAH